MLKFSRPVFRLIETTGSGFKAPDQVQGQGVPRIENGAYTQYVSISIRGTTPPWALRRIFEMGFGFESYSFL